MQLNKVDWHDHIIDTIVDFDKDYQAKHNLVINPCYRGSKDNRLFVDCPSKGKTKENYISSPDIVILKKGIPSVIIEIEDDKEANPKNILGDVLTTAVAKYYIYQKGNPLDLNKILFAIIIKKPTKRLTQRTIDISERLNQIIPKTGFGSINKIFEPIFISNDLRESDSELNKLFKEIN